MIQAGYNSKDGALVSLLIIRLGWENLAQYTIMVRQHLLKVTLISILV